MRISLASGALLLATASAALGAVPGARMFEKLDPDHTDRVTLRHFLHHRSQRFASLDADGDGRVTRGEFAARHLAQDPARVASTFARFDVNGDGAITRAEWDAGETARFRRIDADHDGVVTREEFLSDRAQRE
jgi:Ca2+-binding EF-hand superfamily protein